MADPSVADVRVDDAGLHLEPGFTGSGDVFFDDHHAWSFSAGEGGRGGDEVLVEWPKRMTRWLNGSSVVRVVSGDDEIFAGEVSFGDGKGRVEFVDKDGIPVMIDKWGLLQRPFSGRDPSVVEQMVEVTSEILDVMERECGVRGWIAFGTLLGAAREGRVIGHDSDIDLAYLSEKPTPSEMVTELYDVARALRRHDLAVQHKSGSFITVVFKSPDGGTASIDIYTCFHVGDLLYETATVRAPVPPSAIVPLTELEFEGRMLPAPAHPDRMLAVSYGPRLAGARPVVQAHPRTGGDRALRRLVRLADAQPARLGALPRRSGRRRGPRSVGLRRLGGRPAASTTNGSSRWARAPAPTRSPWRSAASRCWASTTPVRASARRPAERNGAAGRRRSAR